MAASIDRKQINQPAEWQIRQQRRELLIKSLVTMLGIAIASVYLLPFGYGALTSLKTPSQISDPSGSIMPRAAQTWTDSAGALGEAGDEYDLYNVNMPDGSMQELALVKKGRESSTFVNTSAPGTIIEWEGRWRVLDTVTELDPAWGNYPEAVERMQYVQLLKNTFFYAFVSMIGAVGSSAFVAYGFSRFNFPYKGILFMLLLATIILPPQVTLIPQYAFWFRVGLVGTWAPLIIPHYFANAYNVFLLRQYFMTIPPEMEEAATIDGAGPLRTFVSVILPQAGPAMVAVCLFHFFFAWNDFFGPLVYLSGSQNLQPFSVGMTRFNNLFGALPHLVQAGSILTLIIPVTVFFLAQRVFIQGVVVTGNK